MGLAVVFAGNQIGKVAALIAAGLNSAVMLTMTFYFGPDTIRDLRPSLYVLWWLLALATWINESNLQKALDGLAAYRIGLEQRVRERTADLESANQQLHMLNKAKDEFVSSVSHELRTPITSLRMTHALLKRQLPPGGYDKNLATFQRETDRLGTMIESLLLLSSFDQAAVAFRFAQVDLNPLVEDYVTDRIMIAQEKAIELSVELESRPCLVWADEALAGEVVSILLTNAISYTPRGGKVRVKTILDHGRDRLSRGFSVEDTGLGIPPEEQPHLFSRFFRGSAAHDSQAHGTGLGLAIAKEIVDRHNGRLEVYSKGVPGEGTIFHVWLPAKSMG
jgi:two-component system sensor histidine kinase VicK